MMTATEEATIIVTVVITSPLRCDKNVSSLNRTNSDNSNKINNISNNTKQFI